MASSRLVATLQQAVRPCSAGPWVRVGLVEVPGRRWCAVEEEVNKHVAMYPKKFFDFKAFRAALKEKKAQLSSAEIREVQREYCKPPPEGWTVQKFLLKAGITEQAEEVASLFETWEDFASMDTRDINSIPDISASERRALKRHLDLFHHGLWPQVSPHEYLDRFKGKSLKNEGKPWTEADDKELLRLADVYDVNFGDPWIYISHDMQRHEDDVRSRYVEIVEKPKQKASCCEIAVTKASRPLLMSRKFRMLPSDLYIVPSEEHFPLAASNFKLPKAFQKYRQDDIF